MIDNLSNERQTNGRNAKHASNPSASLSLTWTRFHGMLGYQQVNPKKKNKLSVGIPLEILFKSGFFKEEKLG